MLLLSTALLVLFALAGPVGAQPSRGASSTRVTTRDACGSVGPGFARYFAKVVTTTTATGTVAPLATTPIGYTPADLQSAYKLSTTGGTGSSGTEVHYNHPGHAITASSGDSGFGVQFPASSPHVTAVGGTTLNRSANARGWTESAWSGAGSGCSRVYAKPAWQTDTGCARRTVADVSAVADPSTGVAVFDTFGVTGGPWFQFGGTSVSAPIIASVYGLAGNGATVNYGSIPYSHTASLFDVVGGSNTNRRCSPATCAPRWPATTAPPASAPERHRRLLAASVHKPSAATAEAPGSVGGLAVDPALSRARWPAGRPARARRRPGRGTARCSPRPERPAPRP